MRGSKRGVLAHALLLVSYTMAVPMSFNVYVEPRFPFYNPAFPISSAPEFYIYGSRDFDSAVTSIPLVTSNCMDGTTSPVPAYAVPYSGTVFKLTCSGTLPDNPVVVTVEEGVVFGVADTNYVGGTAGTLPPNEAVSATLLFNASFSPYQPPYCGLGPEGNGLPCGLSAPVAIPTPATNTSGLGNYTLFPFSQTIISSGFGAYLEYAPVYDGASRVYIFLAPILFIATAPQWDLTIDTYNCVEPNQNVTTRVVPVVTEDPQRHLYVLVCPSSQQDSTSPIIVTLATSSWRFQKVGGGMAGNGPEHLQFTVYPVPSFYRDAPLVQLQDVTSVRSLLELPWPRLYWQLASVPAARDLVVAPAGTDLWQEPGKPLLLTPDTFASSSALSSEHTGNGDWLVLYLPDVWTGNANETDPLVDTIAHNISLRTLNCVSLNVYTDTVFTRVAQMFAWATQCSVKLCANISVTQEVFVGPSSTPSASPFFPGIPPVEILGIGTRSLPCYARALPSFLPSASPSNSPSATPSSSQSLSRTTTRSQSTSRTLTKSRSGAVSPSSSRTQSVTQTPSVTLVVQPGDGAITSSSNALTVQQLAGVLVGTGMGIGFVALLVFWLVLRRKNSQHTNSIVDGTTVVPMNDNGSITVVPPMTGWR